MSSNWSDRRRAFGARPARPGERLIDGPWPYPLTAAEFKQMNSFLIAVAQIDRDIHKARNGRAGLSVDALKLQRQRMLWGMVAAGLPAPFSDLGPTLPERLEAARRHRVS